GEPFFPEFTDPNAARTLEVIEFDENTGEARPFKVTFQGGRWTIPSHYDYPADGKDRLAQTAASLIGITRDDFRTDNVADYAACGVIDPLDDSVVELKGRGKRVTIKGENDVILADLIIGKSYEDRENFHLVRLPGQKRVYGSLIDVDLSTKFSDWIETDLLELDADELQKIDIKDYSINEATKKIEMNEDLLLSKQDGDNWVASDMRDDEEVDKYKMNNFVKALDELSIVGVRPKPAGLSASLQQTSGKVSISTNDLLSLQDKGFYFTGDGLLRSNEGELVATTIKGVSYTLRFGEVAYGTEFEVSSGTAGGDKPGGPAENRYLMITTSFDESVFSEPPLPDNDDYLEKPDSLWTAEDHRMKSMRLTHDEWEKNLTEGRELSDELNARFADWYYVISADSFHKLNVTRDDLIKEKPKPK
ncbi:MAG: DUF4340 domain-containing protein, partial [Candidatus Latescibacterota bacterium]